MLGLAETSAGTMVVWECPRCGQKWSSTIGRRMPVKLTITPPSSSLTAAAIPIGLWCRGRKKSNPKT